MVKPEVLEQASTGTYRFCANRECRTVYFEENDNRVFTTDDLRVTVGLKTTTDPNSVRFFGLHLQLSSGPRRLQMCSRNGRNPCRENRFLLLQGATLAELWGGHSFCD